jgi:hypothetical protein
LSHRDEPDDNHGRSELAQNTDNIPARKDKMPEQPSPSHPPQGTTTIGNHAVAIGGNNVGTINTGVIVNISGDDIEKNIDVARMILAASLLAPPLDPARKANVADYYLRIATTLSEAADALRRGVVPHGKCGEMRFHAEHLPETIGDVIGPTQATALSCKLMESYKVESFGYQFMSLPPAERDAKFGGLDEAAGYFRAAADALRLRR